nr:IS66 family transposase [Bradyrhizobium centrosematis]
MLFRYAPGRSGAFAEQFLHGFNGRFLQCDDDRLTKVARPKRPWTLVHCWSHLHRRLLSAQQQIADCPGCGSAHRTALRHGSHATRFIAGHPAGRAQGALAANRRRA